MSRFHLLAPANAPVTKSFCLDGFAQATFRFAQILRALGHETILYGSDLTTAPCSEFVKLLDYHERQALTHSVAYQSVPIDPNHSLWKVSNARAIEAIKKRKQPRDFLLTISGLAHKPVFDAHPDLMGVEYSIGYEGNFAPFRVFESHAWKHYCYGAQGITSGRFFDAVIPLFFDVSDFPSQTAVRPRNYLLFVGRLTDTKGLDIAVQVAKTCKVPLRVVGHGKNFVPPTGVEFFEAADCVTRNELMRDAIAVIAPTLYVEPFNAVAVEAQLCGTPVISTDWGGFTETIDHGVTGFRCHYLGDFLEAVNKCADGVHLSRAYIQARARKLYGMGTAAKSYSEYFQRLELLWERGWETK